MAENTELCPCGSGRPYGECCEPIIAGRKPALTAEALMRSRYSAYAKCEIDWIRDSAGDEVRAEFNPEESRRWAESATWTGMEVVRTEGGGENDAEGMVEFIAHYSVNGTEYAHHERSVFKKINGSWLFIDGEMVKPTPFRREAEKIGRNDPCPCGSGKKYKKCCGKDA